MHKQLFLVLLLLFGLSTIVSGQNATLPAEARAVMGSNLPQWKIVENSCQTVVTGDYNKDLISDYAAVISGDGAGKVVVLLSDGKGYKLFTVRSMDEAESQTQMLSAIRKGEWVVAEGVGKTGQPEIKVNTDAFYVGECGATVGTSYVYYNNEFVKMNQGNAGTETFGQKFLGAFRGKKKTAQKPQPPVKEAAKETANQKTEIARQPETTPASAKTASKETSQKTDVKLYVFEIGKGKVGCGDKLVEVPFSVVKQPSVLRAALEELFRYPEKPGFANSTLGMTLKDVKLVNGVATINIRGSLAGECDDPRFIAQITSTAKQFPTVKSVKIFLNGREFTGSLK